MVRFDAATVNLIDLAGCENIKASGADSDPERLKEAQFINSSLSTLGNVIMALSKKVIYSLQLLGSYLIHYNNKVTPLFITACC